MPVTLKIGDKEYRFENEADVNVAQQMSEHIRQQTKNEADAAASEKEGEHKATLEDHIAKLKAAQEALAKAEADLKAFMSEEQQEDRYQERKALEGDEEAVVANASEEDKKALKTELSNCKTMNSRVRAVTVRVMNSRGVDLSKADDATILTTFKTLAATAKANKGSDKTQLPNGGTQRTQNSGEKKNHPYFARKS